MSVLSEKALKERNFRKRENERKRFEKPLRVFLQHKYGTIYEEYQELYNLMVVNHPGRRNLINTKTFKEWKRANEKASSEENQTPPNILSVAINETLGELPGERILTGPGSERIVVSEESKVVVASQEGEQTVASDIADIERQIDDIVNELMLEEDEGIGINVFDEIGFDIEPFDYELEVESD